MATAREGRSLQGSVITGDDIEDYRAVPPMSLVLSPTPSRPTEADVDIVREAVRTTVLDGLRAEAGADVGVSFDLGEVVELTFVPDDGDGRGGSKLRRRNLASSVSAVSVGTSTSRRRTQDTPAAADSSSSSSAYTIVGFGESQVTYRAPLLSDFTPPSQTAFEEETWVAVADDATAKIPDAIRTAVAASVGGEGGSAVLAGLQGATADLTYEPPAQVPSSGAAEEVKQEPSVIEPEPKPEPEPVEMPEPESMPEPVEEELQPVEEMPEEEEEEEEEEEKIEDILPVEEEVAQPPDSAKEGSDGETLTVPTPIEEEQAGIVEKGQPDEGEAGAETEAEASAPVQEEKEVDDELQQDQDEGKNEEEEQTNILPLPTPEDGEEGEKEEDAVVGIPAKDDEKQDTVSSPQDSAVPPPLFGGGDYTGDSSVSSVGIAEGGADGTVSRGGGAGGDGPAIGAIVGGCMAALLAVLFITAMFVKRRRRRQAFEEGGKRTKLQSDVEDGGELGADNTFELDDSGELMLNGMHVEPADGNLSNENLRSQDDDEGSEEGKTGGNGYLPTGLFGSFVGGKKSARRKATPRKTPKAATTSMDEENSDEEDSILTDWSGAPSVNSLGHSVQGSVADDEPSSITNDLAKTYNLSKSRSGGANVLLQFQKKKERKRSKSMDLYGQQPNVRTEEDFERQRNAASISLRKDMMCTVDSMSAYPMHGRSRSADHGLLAPGTSLLGTSSPEAPEAAWIWGSRNEADMRPKNGGGPELQML